ncbi:hypothetical protein [Coleofasciculus sp. H7-2]|uniref:hypothetical protein n=1 Tax=Coleofasciculus sp. H7-2 TaxID=3351545 RepID=UPI00366B80AA
MKLLASTLDESTTNSCILHPSQVSVNPYPCCAIASSLSSSGGSTGMLEANKG